MLAAGIVYALVKLGDELVMIADDIVWGLEKSFIFRISIDDFFEFLNGEEMNLQTIVLGLLAIFLVLAIADYVMNEV